MGILWGVHEVSLENLWWFYDKPMGFRLDSVRFPWYVFDISIITMGFLWGVNGISMGFLWGFKRMPMGFPLDSYEISMMFL